MCEQVLHGGARGVSVGPVLFVRILCIFMCIFSFVGDKLFLLYLVHCIMSNMLFYVLDSFMIINLVFIMDIL